MGEETSRWRRFFLSQQLTSVPASTATFLPCLIQLNAGYGVACPAAIATFVEGGRGALHD